MEPQLKNFGLALKCTRDLLSLSPELRARGSIETESEQIVLAAYRSKTGKKLSRVELYSSLQEPLPGECSKEVFHLSVARVEGNPLQHLIGYQTFLDHEFSVSPHVLVPRPETEVLVTEAIRILEKIQPKVGIEIGTGSGIISIELLSRFSDLQMLASDISEDALEIARKNADKILGEGHGLHFFETEDPKSVFEVFGHLSYVDFIVSNPPYLSLRDEIDAEVFRHEPRGALFAPEEDLLYFYKEIEKNSGKYLNLDGFVFLEIPHERAQKISSLFSSSKWKMSLVQDLTGRDRVLIAQRK